MAELHVNHGKRVELRDARRTAVNTGDCFNTVVFSALPLPDGVRYDVKVEKLMEGYVQMMSVGVTTRNPTSLPQVPADAEDVPDSWVVRNRTVYTCGEKPGDCSETGTYPDHLSVTPGDKMGVSKSGTSVYIHRDGRRLAPLWEDISGPVWAVIGLVDVKQLSVIQPELMTSIKDIETHLSPETTSNDRLCMIREITTLYQMENQSDHCSQLVRIISTLLQLALGPRGSGDLEEYIVGDKVRSMITDLAIKAGNPTEICQALITAVKQKDVTGERLTQTGAKIIHKWFCDNHDTLVVKTGPGWIQSLQIFFEACLEKDRLVGGKVEGGKYIENALRPVIKGCLQNDTSRTMDATDDMSMSIYNFAITWGMSGLIQELQNVWSKPNLTTNEMIWNCLTKILHTKLQPNMSQLMQDAVKGLVSNEHFNVTAMAEDKTSRLLRLLTSAKNEDMDDNIGTFIMAADMQGKSILDKCIDKYQNAPTLELGLSLLAEMGANPHLTPQTIRHCLAKLIKIKPGSDLIQNYKAVIKTWASNATYNVNEVTDEDEGWTISHMIAKEGNAEAMKGLLEVNTFEANKEDEMGNSPLFYLCKSFKPAIVMKMIDSGRWNIDVKNKADENLLDFYMTIEQPDRQLAKYISNKLSSPIKKSFWKRVTATLGLKSTAGKKSVQERTSTTFGWESTAETLLPESGQAATTSFPPRAVKKERTIKCDYWRLCAAHLDNLNIPDAYFEPKFDFCYCDKCMGSRGDELYYTRGDPPTTYGLPVGWARFGLRPPPQAEALNVFTKWHVAYHGTVPENLESILHSKDLLMPGDVTFSGIKLEPPPGHFKEDEKPEGFDIKRIFVTPTIKYAALPAYAKFRRWTDPDTKKDHTVQAAFQVRVKPGSYEVGPETCGLGKSVIDEKFQNEELEWSTKQRGTFILTGILVLLK